MKKSNIVPVNERKWDASKTELAFERLVTEHQYTILGVKEYQSKTVYVIEKEGTVCEFSIGSGVPNSEKRAKDCFDTFEKFFGVQKKYDAATKAAEN